MSKTKTEWVAVAISDVSAGDECRAEQGASSFMVAGVRRNPVSLAVRLFSSDNELRIEATASTQVEVKRQ